LARSADRIGSGVPAGLISFAEGSCWLARFGASRSAQRLGEVFSCTVDGAAIESPSWYHRRICLRRSETAA
jgi:hypothetical protein